MQKCICGEHVSELSIHTKQYIRCMEIIERAKRDANMEGIDEIYTDLSDIFDSPDFEDEVCCQIDSFHTASEQINELFKSQFIAILEVRENQGCDSQDLKKRNLVIDRVVPIGGNSRILTLREIILDSMKMVLGHKYTFTQTVNVDECMVLGATLFTHLLSENRIIFDGRASEYVTPFVQLKKGDTCSNRRRTIHIAVDDLITIPDGTRYELTRDGFD